MKKFILIIIMVLIFNTQVFAKSRKIKTKKKQITKIENTLENNLKNQNDENFEPIILEPQEQSKEFEQPLVEEKTEEKEEISPYTKDALKGILTKDYDLNSTSGMFKDQLTFKFKKGPIKENTFQLSHILYFQEQIDKHDSDFDFNYNTINLGIKGKFRGDKESYNLLLNFSPDIHQHFWHRLVLDAWVQSKRIPHHTVTFGTYRPTVGYEGAQSAFLVPFISRSQTARTYGNIRKTGLSVKGDYKYVDYDISGFSSDTWYSEFFPGVETDLWINFKPLANLDSKKYGKLKIGGGLQAGGRNAHDYLVSQASLKYEYKKFWAMVEYANADGSNGASGITEKKSWGYNATLAYRLTKKLEFLLRFDDFDPNKEKSKNNVREYSAGINYFILGQTLRVMLNYVFCQREGSDDSHRIILGSQILL